MALAAFFIALPLLRGTISNTNSPLGQGELNLQVFRRRLEELDGDLAAGLLDQGQFEAARHDLERELLSDLKGSGRSGDATGVGSAGTDSDATVANRSAGPAPWLTLLLVFAVPAAAVLTYVQLGNPQIIPSLETAAIDGAPDPATGPDGQQGPALDTLAQGLAERMEQNPDNLEGWLMLGRTYFALEQPAKALQAIERANQLAPDQVAVMLAYAEALAANNGNSLVGRPAELVRTALEREPANPSARWLNGMLAFQQERFADAAGTWQTVLDELDPAAQEAQEMRQMIAEARGRGGLPEIPPQAPSSLPANPATAASDTTATAGSAAAAANAGASLRVSVALAPALSAQVRPDDTVFVFARAADGPPMPLAVSRIKAADLPTTVTLDDSMAMLPSMRLSSFAQVIVGARVSKSGAGHAGPRRPGGPNRPPGTHPCPAGVGHGRPCQALTPQEAQNHRDRHCAGRPAGGTRNGQDLGLRDAPHRRSSGLSRSPPRQPSRIANQ